MSFTDNAAFCDLLCTLYVRSVGTVPSPRVDRSSGVRSWSLICESLRLAVPFAYERPRRVRLAALSVRCLPAGVTVPLGRPTRRQAVVGLRYVSPPPAVSHHRRRVARRRLTASKVFSMLCVYGSSSSGGGAGIRATASAQGITLISSNRVGSR